MVGSFVISLLQIFTKCAVEISDEDTKLDSLLFMAHPVVVVVVACCFMFSRKN